MLGADLTCPLATISSIMIGFQVAAGHLTAGDVLLELDTSAVSVGTQAGLVEHDVGDVSVGSHHSVHDPVRCGFVDEPAAVAVDQDDPARQVRLDGLHEVRVEEPEPAVLADDLRVDGAAHHQGIPTSAIGSDVPHPVAGRGGSRIQRLEHVPVGAEAPGGEDHRRCDHLVVTDGSPDDGAVLHEQPVDTLAQGDVDPPLGGTCDGGRR